MSTPPTGGKAEFVDAAQQSEQDYPIASSTAPIMVGPRSAILVATRINNPRPAPSLVTVGGIAATRIASDTSRGTGDLWLAQNVPAGQRDVTVIWTTEGSWTACFTAMSFANITQVSPIQSLVGAANSWTMNGHGLAAAFWVGNVADLNIATATAGTIRTRASARNSTYSATWAMTADNGVFGISQAANRQYRVDGVWLT